MSSNTQNKPTRSDTVKMPQEEHKERQSGILPYVIGGLFGVAAGLAASYYIDKTVAEATENMDAPVHVNAPGNCSTSCQSKGGVCVVCQDNVESTVITPCCKQLLHTGCYQEYRRNRYQKCPLCRKSWN